MNAAFLIAGTMWIVSFFFFPFLFSFFLFLFRSKIVSDSLVQNKQIHPCRPTYEGRMKNALLVFLTVTRQGGHYWHAWHMMEAPKQ